MTTTHHDLDHLDRVRRVTAAYHEFQGLGMVVLGLALGVFTLTFHGRLEYAALGLLVTLVLFAVTARYYRRRFGEVRPRRTALGRLGSYLVAPASLVGGVALYVYTQTLGLESHVVLGVLGACALLLPAVREVRLRAHYVVCATLLALLSLSPIGLLTGGTHPLAITEPHVFGLLLAGVLIVCGLLDHRVLVRTFPEAEANGAD